MWFEAVLAYLEPSTRALAAESLAYLTIPFKNDPDWARRPSNGTFVSRLEDERHHHIFRSYAKGTSPETGYRFDHFELDVVLSRDAGPRGWTVHLRSSGADNPRPFYLKKSTQTGLWFVDQFGNAYVGVRPPVDPETEQFV